MTAPANYPENEHPFAQALERANAALEAIGDYAHDNSTGPAVWDPLWEVRRMAYEGVQEALSVANSDLAIDAAREQDRARAAAPSDPLAAHRDLLTYVLQGDVHNRLTPRVIDIAYTAFMQAKQPNAEDGGSSDWFNDTKPVVEKAIDKLRKNLMEDRAAAPPPAVGDVALIIEALEHSQPTHTHYPEPVERHARALAAARAFISKAPPAVGVSDADIDRIVPALAPIGEDFPAEWALWKDRERIRTELRALCASKPEDGPEGCTPADARMLRAANHGLADESHELQETLADLLGQVNSFCERHGEADFETGRATALIERLRPDVNSIFQAAPAEAPANEGGNAFERECDDIDAILRHLGLNPEQCRTDGGALNVPRIKSLLIDAPTLAAPAQGDAEPMSQAVRDVLAERQRQISAEGWTPKHDDEHVNTLGEPEMAIAAACYAMAGTSRGETMRRLWWPWAATWWKPTTPRRNLEKAGALILAEMERLDRATARTRPDGFPAWICKGCSDPNFCVSIQGCDTEEINK